MHVIGYQQSHVMEVLCSHLGDENGDGKGGFVVFDQEFKLKGTWGQELTDYGYDFWCACRR